MIVCTDLRSQIVSLMEGLIGTYEHTDGYIEPAIAVLPDSESGWNYPSTGTVATGIEVVITRPYPGAIPLLNNERMKPLRWGITLKQWDSSKSLLDATTALVDGLAYHHMTLPRLVPPNAALGIIEQVTFELIEWEFQEIKQRSQVI